MLPRMKAQLKRMTHSLSRFAWKRRHRVVMGVRGIGNGALNLYRRIPIPTSVRLAVKDVIFMSIEHFVIRTSLYQSWLRQRTGAARIHALLTPGHLSSGSQNILAPMPTAPDDAAWDALPDSARKRGEFVEGALVDIVLPVYRGYDETLNCIYTVLNNPQKTPYELVVINDFSPEPALSEKLRVLCAKGLFTLIENEENKGFVTTVNRGMRQHENRDVILLNSDTEVYNDWLDRMLAVGAQNQRTATVTPFSNNAEIYSYPYFVQDNIYQLELPYAELDKLVAAANPVPNVELPTAVGFCMYIKRAALRDVGYFDEVTFGKGYGEENDFCLRATAKGWKHTIAGNVFVRHLGGTSFAKEKLKRIEKAIATIHRLYPHYNAEVQRFIASDPLRDLRAAIDLARLKRLGKGSNMLFISHQIGGGTGKHVKELTESLTREGLGAFTLHPLSGTNGLIGLSHPDAPHIPNLYFSVDTDREALKTALSALNITHMHIHHVINFVPSMVDFLLSLSAESALTYDVTLHDYFFACPRINLIASDGTYCGQPDLSGCEQCIRSTPSHAGAMPVWQWRMMFGRLLAGARKRFVPDLDVAVRMRQYFPDVVFDVRPHPEHWPTSGSLYTPREQGETLRIGILGAISQVKGSEVIAALAKDAEQRKLPIEFILIGHTDNTELNAGSSNLTVTGQYRESELPALLQAHRPHLLLIPTIIPESYCYTLSEAWHYGIPPVVFDIGAQGARVGRSGQGLVLPLALSENAQALNNRLLEESMTLQEPRDYKAAEYAPFLERYYEMDAEELSGQANRSAA